MKGPKGYTVGDLLNVLHRLPRHTVVLVPGADHSYTPARGRVSSAMLTPYDTYSEDHGDLTPEGDHYGERVRAVVIQ